MNTKDIPISSSLACLYVFIILWNLCTFEELSFNWADYSRIKANTCIIKYKAKIFQMVWTEKAANYITFLQRKLYSLLFVNYSNQTLIVMELKLYLYLWK